jgi:hypothetical protein
MEYVPYVGFGKYRRTTVKINLYFKRIMIKQIICIKKEKEKGVVIAAHANFLPRPSEQ